jgi:hypothetical protein
MSEASMEIGTIRGRRTRPDERGLLDGGAAPPNQWSGRICFLWLDGSDTLRKKPEESAMPYVVYSEPQRGEHPFARPFKVFSNRRDASQFAESEVCGETFKASVYEVAIDDARKAIEAVRKGEVGAPVEVKKSGVGRTDYRNDRAPRESSRKVGHNRMMDEIGRHWLQVVALQYGWFELPAKRKVARNYDTFKGQKFSTFGEALNSFLVSSAPAERFSRKDADGYTWPFELRHGETVAQAIRREAERRIAAHGTPRFTIVYEGDVEF